MKRTALVVAVAASFAVCSAIADYSVNKEGAWPGSWPQELERLRKQSGTIQGSLADTSSWSSMARSSI